MKIICHLFGGAEEIFRTAERPVLTTVGPHATPLEIVGHLPHILYATDFGLEQLKPFSQEEAICGNPSQIPAIDV